MGPGGLKNYNAPAKYRNLFSFTIDTEVTDLYTGLEKIFARVNSFEHDYEEDEKEAK